LSKTWWRFIKIAFSLLVLLAYPSLALKNNIGGNARISAIGFTQVAGGSEESSLLANPASFGSSSFSISLARTELFSLGVFYNYFESSIRLSPKWRASFCLETLEDEDIVDNSGYCQKSIVVGLTNKINERLQIGVSINDSRSKHFDEAMGSGKALSFGLKAGLWDIGKARFDAGVKVENLVSFKEYESGRKETPEKNIVLGFGIGSGNRIYALDLAKDSIRCGFEYKISELLNLRAGFVDGQLTTGIGIRNGYIKFDYAYWLASAGVTQRLGTTFSF
jgi:hypothetical protein